MSLKRAKDGKKKDIVKITGTVTERVTELIEIILEPDKSLATNVLHVTAPEQELT